MKRLMRGDDRGSITPLVLGFFVLALFVVAGAVMASDVFTRQRDLQSVCDGAAVAASNAVDRAAVRAQALGTELPLQSVQDAVDHYLTTSGDGGRVEVVASLTAGGATVETQCHARSRVAFGNLVGRGSGIDQYAQSQAQGVVN
jgi:uncharacterized membrane protein